jgi:outer membrane protein TolC
MKRFPRFRAVAASALVLPLLGLPGRASAQEQPAISARPGQRKARPLPAPAQGGIRLSLSEAVGLAIQNNQDLNVSVHEAEAARYGLLRDLGIFDPLLAMSAARSHSEDPATSQLVGATISERDSLDVTADITQLLPSGGSFTLGYGTNRTSTNSAFFFVNPAYTSGFTLSASQPLLRNFGWDATTWLIRTSRNTRDIRYQDFLRDVQATVNAVEQGYWDLVYALQNLEVKKESRAISADLNRITRIKIDVGSLAPISLL